MWGTHLPKIAVTVILIIGDVLDMENRREVGLLWEKEKK